MLTREGARHFLVNPQITWASTERFTMWDDCMSFSFLLVRLERHRSISIHFQNENGEQKDWDHLDSSISELLQHEIDHLNGVLAVDRALDKDSIIMRSTYLEMPEYFRRLADYEIPATSGPETVGSVYSLTPPHSHRATREEFPRLQTLRSVTNSSESSATDHDAT